MYVRPALILLISLNLFLVGCARTHVTGVWIKKDFAGPPMQSLMILAQTKDKKGRAYWENIISDRFRQSRMDALPAVNAFSISKPANLVSVLDYAKQKGIEGLLVIRHVETRMVEKYHPPQTRYYYDYYYPYWWYPTLHYGPYRPPGYYPWPGPWFLPFFFYEQEVVVSPGYTSYHRVYLVESYLYAVSSSEQVWSMTVETVNPRSENHLIADVSRSVFRGLKRTGLIRLTR